MKTMQVIGNFTHFDMKMKLIEPKLRFFVENVNFKA